MLTELGEGEIMPTPDRQSSRTPPTRRDRRSRTAYPPPGKHRTGAIPRGPAKANLPSEGRRRAGCGAVPCEPLPTTHHGDPYGQRRVVAGEASISWLYPTCQRGKLVRSNFSSHA